MLLAGALVSSLWLAGCASLQPKTAEEQVRERAEALGVRVIDAAQAPGRMVVPRQPR